MLYANAETCGDLKMVAGRWLSPPWPCLVREKKLIITTTLCWANNGQHVWCEGFRGSAGTLPFCIETYCHWSAPGRVPVSSTHTPACPTPRTIPQAGFFSLSVSCSFSKPYCLRSFSQTQLLIILSQSLGEGSPHSRQVIKKRKINLIQAIYRLASYHILKAVPLFNLLSVKFYGNVWLEN